MAQSKDLELFSVKVSRLVNPKIKEVLGLSVSKETKLLLNHQVDVGGKRWRPILAVLSCLVCGGRLKDVIYPAAGLEILHTCTLIYDDVIDNSTFRRNKPTTWSKFGKSIAECIGLDYTAAIFQAANLSNRPLEVSKVLAKTLKEVMEGEMLDILFEQSGREDEKYVVQNRYKRISQKDYLDMIKKKTASLIGASAEVGGIAAGAKKSEIKALANYGFNQGIAFQIQDDILDIFGKKTEFGKKIGGDIKERKLGNIVILLALEELSSGNRKKLLAILKKKEIKNEDIKEAIKIIKGTKARERAFSLGKRYIAKAKVDLGFLPQNKWNKLLAKMADFTIERTK